MGRIIGIMSFKGGVGKTISVINLGAALSKLGKKVIIIEGNFLSPTLHIYLGLLNPEISLKEVIEKDLMPEEAIYEHSSGVHVMPCNFYKEIDFLKFKEKINQIKKNYDYILVDSGPSYSEEILGILMVSEEIIFVTTPDYPTLSTTLRAAELIKKKNLPIRGIIVNKKRKKSYELDSKDIEKTTGLPVIAEIRDENKIMISVSKFMPITHHYPRNKCSKNYLKLAKFISNDGDELEYLSKKLKEAGVNYDGKAI
jgi:MinD-like ATPase involved in chromosome partitioning or flagellar assembly